MMESIKTYIGYVMGILGFAGVVWTYASKSASKEYSVAGLKKDITELREDMVTKDDLRLLVDSIDHYNERVEGKINEVIRRQNGLRNSYVKLVDLQIKEKDVWRDLLNGIEWVVSPIEDKRTDTIDFKIKIRKKQ